MVIIYDNNILSDDYITVVALLLIKTGNLFGYGMYYVPIRIFYLIVEFIYRF